MPKHKSQRQSMYSQQSFGSSSAVAASAAAAMSAIPPSGSVSRYQPYAAGKDAANLGYSNLNYATPGSYSGYGYGQYNYNYPSNYGGGYGNYNALSQYYTR
jgi:hypothetical protein